MAASKKKPTKEISIPIPAIPIDFPPVGVAVSPRIVPLFRKAHTSHHLAIGVLGSGITSPVNATVTFVLGSKVIEFEDVKIKKILGLDFIALVAKRKPVTGGVIPVVDDVGVGTLVVTVVGTGGTVVPVSGTGGLGEPTP
jgi:hypothetical protein